MNVFSFTGNLGKDCRVGSGSTAMIGFGVGVKSGWGEKAQTVWVDCTVWGKQAEGRLSEYLVKGAAVAITGELGTRDHDGKTYVTCNVSRVDLIGGKPEGQQQAPRQQAPQQSKPAPNYDSFDDEIGF